VLKCVEYERAGEYFGDGSPDDDTLIEAAGPKTLPARWKGHDDIPVGEGK
jgi:hypothetical protein